MNSAKNSRQAGLEFYLTCTCPSSETGSYLLKWYYFENFLVSIQTKAYRISLKIVSKNSHAVNTYICTCMYEAQVDRRIGTRLAAAELWILKEQL